MIDKNVIKEVSYGGGVSDSSSNLTPIPNILNYDDSDPDLVNSRTNRYAINQLTQKIENVNQYLKSGHDSTSFIEFWIGDETKRNTSTLHIDTRDINSFKHYAISMENKKTGVGAGNKFTIKIAYHKDFSNIGNINQFEAALAGLRLSSTFDSSSNWTGFDYFRDTLEKNICCLQYGYISNDNNLISPLYKGMLLKYTVNASKQIVEYTLEGYTSTFNLLELPTVNWYPLVQRIETQDDGTEKISVGYPIEPDKDISELDEEEYKKYLQSLDDVYSGSTMYMQPYLALVAFVQNYNSSHLGWKFKIIDCTNKTLKGNYTLEPVRMSPCRQQTPLQYIQYCISLFKFAEDGSEYAIDKLKNQGKTSPRFVYDVIDDFDNKTTKILIDIIDDTDINSKVAYKFRGYSPDNSLLVDYNLTYDGTVALTVSNMVGSSGGNEEDTSIIYIDNRGLLRRKSSISRDIFTAGELSQVLISKQNTWLDKIAVSNNCTMTTFGLPFEISTGTIFNCGIYIGEVLHHTSGNCFVTEVTDKIQNNQFTSNFKMIRLPGANPDMT